MGRKAGKHTQTERCFLILARLRGMPEGIFLADLAEEFNTDRRQIERDLLAMESGTIHCDIIKRDRLGPTGATRPHAVAILREPATKQVTLTRQERFTILAVRRMFDVLAGTPFYDDMQRVCEKLMQRVPKQDRAELAALGERFVYVPDGGTKRLEEDAMTRLEMLRMAVMNKRVVRYEYTRASGKRERGYLAPYAMVMYRNGLYVVGRNGKRAEHAASPTKATLPRHAYAAERFKAVEMLDGLMTYEMPKELRLDHLFHGAFGIFIGEAEPQRVVVEFARSKAPLALARKWHPMQGEPETLPDGRVRLTFMLRDLKEVRSWILSWGPSARAIEPPALVAQVAQELADASEWYAMQRAALKAAEAMPAVAPAIEEKRAA